MKTLLSMVMVVTLISLTAIPAVAQDDEAEDAVAEVVTFPDAKLDELIREILKRKEIDKVVDEEEEEINEGTITTEDLQTISFLHGNGRGITDLTGLEHCRNLAEVWLADNQITDVSPLTNSPNLQSLNLADNRIADIEPLRKLKKLQYLRLDHNSIQQIDAIADIEAIVALYLEHNEITSLEPLAELPKLYAIYASHNQISDLTPVGTVKLLERLDVSHNQIVDLSPLERLTEMRWTFLMENKITDISPLVRMAKVDADGDQRFAPYWKLYLAANPLPAGAEGQLVELREIGVRLDMEYVR